jgi:hypothetical protein
MKIYLIALVFTSFIFAQVPSIQWQKRMGGSVSAGAAASSGTCMCPTSDGGFFVGGRSSCGVSYEKTSYCRGGTDYWVLKLDANGAIQWDKTFGGGNPTLSSNNGLDDLFSVKQATDGGYILGGFSESSISGDKTDYCKGQWDYWIVKISNVGAIEWQRSLGGFLSDQGGIVITTQDNGFLIGGSSTSHNDGDKSEDIRGGGDIWLIKLDSAGATVWDKTIGGSGTDSMSSMIQNPDGTYIIAGISKSNISGEKTENSRGGNDIWMLKLDSNGNLLNQKTIGGNLNDGPSKIIQTNDSNYLISGSSNSPISGEKTDYCRGGYDCWLLKIDPLFNIIWQKTIGGSGYDGGTGVFQCTDNGYIVCSSSDSNISGDKTTTNIGGYDAWIIKLNDTGEIQWQKTIGGDAEDYLNIPIQLTDGSFVLFGSTYSNISGDIIDFPRGLSDYWMVKLNPENLTTSQNTINNLQVFPNPTTGIVTINFGQIQETVTLTLTNVLGQTVSSKKLHQLENANYYITGSSGIYFITIESEKGAKTTIKVIKD